MSWMRKTETRDSLKENPILDPGSWILVKAKTIQRQRLEKRKTDPGFWILDKKNDP
jgi:hypothetical protein